MTGNRVRAALGRRRSGAAGPHCSWTTRAEELAAALDDWTDKQPTDTPTDTLPTPGGTP